MAAERHGDAGSLHGRLVVPQLVDPLLLQQEGLLWGRNGHGGGCRHLPPRAAGLALPSLASLPSMHRPHTGHRTLGGQLPGEAFPVSALKPEWAQSRE